jgi:long-subunit fatty acid transport protein
MKGGTSIQAPGYLIEAYPAFRDSGTRASFTTPDLISLGFFNQLAPELTLLADVQYITWSVVKALNFTYDNGRSGTSPRSGAPTP